RPGRARVAAGRARGAVHVQRDLDVAVDLDAVVVDRETRPLDLLAAAVDGGGELDVIALPHRRRLAGVHQRRRHAEDRAAIDAARPQTVAVQNLYLVAPLQIDAAVAP